MPTFQFYKEDEANSSSTDDWGASLISSSKYSSPIVELTDDGLYIDEMASIFNEDEDESIAENDREMEEGEGEGEGEGEVRRGSVFASTDKRWILSLKPLLSDLASLYPELSLTKSNSRHLILRTREFLALLKKEKQKLDVLVLDNNRLKSIFASLYETIGSFYALLSMTDFESQLDLVAAFKNLQSKLTTIQAESRWAQQQLKNVSAQQDQKSEDYIRLMNELSEKEALILELKDVSDKSLSLMQHDKKDAALGLHMTREEEDPLDLTEEEWQERNAALDRMNASSAALSTSIEMLHDESEFVLQQAKPGVESIAHLIGVPQASAVERSPILSEEENGVQIPLLDPIPASQNDQPAQEQELVQVQEHECEREQTTKALSGQTSPMRDASCQLTDTTRLPEWTFKYPNLKQELSALCANEERLQDALNRLQSQHDALMQRQFDIQSENEMLHYQIKSFQLENTLLFEKAQELLMMTFDFKSTQIQVSAIRSVTQPSPLMPNAGSPVSGHGASASLVPAMNAMSVEANAAIHRLGSLLKAATTPTPPCPMAASAPSPSSSLATGKSFIESQSVARYVELLKTEFTSTIEALRGNYELALKNETKERVKYQNLYEGLKSKMHRLQNASQEGYRNASTQSFFFDTN